MKKVLAMMMLAVFLLCSHMSVYAATSFTDLPQTHWAYENIMKLVEEGVINGYPDGTYKPESPVTRAEYLKLVLTTCYINPFYFMGNGLTKIHWGFPYYQESIEEGYLMEGTENYYIGLLDENITRLEMAVILGKFCERWDYIDFGRNYEYHFSDISALDEVYQKYIGICAKNGFITGYPDGTFGTDKTMTRAECATVIARLASIYE